MDHAPRGDGDSDESVARTRDDEFWYSDGSIILVARDVEFRVYKGLLTHHSPVFRDMFSLAQPPAVSSSVPVESAETLCPVVRLSDSPEDMRHILRVYMPRHGPSTSRHSYHAISAAVRLGHKYQMRDLLDSAILFLKTHYPMDYDDWTEFGDCGAPSFSLEHAIGVVNLARLVGDSDLLVIALLVCCHIDDADALIHGFEREDGSREQLTPEDIALCESAKRRLLEESKQVSLRVCLGLQVSDACMTRSRCLRRLEQARLELGDTETTMAFIEPSERPRPLDDLIERSDPGLCAHCQKTVADRDLCERKALWETLPEIFGIELPKVANDEGQAVGDAVHP
ncbi:uncharacterized protein TRAVEDRAFT_128217 [Trametes versicolor FP-101664 SS1]|uniref:uncharacterized protein n=1 Tax=Trametes versicolor (strain FP-101664) TaxID=717944 RepID=UPI00046221C0|nr:uncharacterized protein TRAVEDRAFT_128217 [Trametes versicolor FP-101664 SS1]EIW56927.1 hypothetical protein TRAVEDRAFT_128217 [Trametes versicolor FP-101664 SS1]